MKYVNLFGLWLLKNAIAVKSAANVSLVTGFFGATAAWFSESVGLWIDGSRGYVAVVLGTVAVDHLLGSFVHWLWKDDFSWLKNIGGFALKLLLVICMGFMFEGLGHIVSEDNFMYTYLKTVGRLIVFFYPFRSACLNAAIMTNGVFPPLAFINKITGFQKSLDLQELKAKTNDKTEENGPDNIG